MNDYTSPSYLHGFIGDLVDEEVLYGRIYVWVNGDARRVVDVRVADDRLQLEIEEET